MKGPRQPSINPSVIVEADGSPIGEYTVLNFSGFGSVAPGSSPGEIVITSGGSGSGVLFRDTGLVTVANTTTETALAAFDIPADTLDIDGRKVIMEQRGDIFNNGLSRNLTWRVYFGGTLIYEDLIAMQSISQRRPFWLRTEIIRISAAAQMMYGRLIIAAPDNIGPSVGTAGGLTQNVGQPYTILTESLAEDPSTILQLRTTIEMSSATANMNIRQQSYQVRSE